MAIQAEDIEFDVIAKYNNKMLRDGLASDEAALKSMSQGYSSFMSDVQKSILKSRVDTIKKIAKLEGDRLEKLEEQFKNYQSVINKLDKKSLSDFERNELLKAHLHQQALEEYARLDKEYYDNEAKRIHRASEVAKGKTLQRQKDITNIHEKYEAKREAIRKKYEDKRNAAQIKAEAAYKKSAKKIAGFTETMFGDVGSSFGHKLATTAQYSAAGAGVYTVAGAFKSAAAESVNYDDALFRNMAVLQMNREESEKLAKATRDVSIEYGGSIKELDDVALALGRAGVANEDLAAATKLTAQLATITGDSLAESSKAVASYSVVYGDAAHGMVELGNLLALAANASKLSIADLNTAGNYALSVSKNLGLSVESMLAMEAAFSKIGVNASTIGTQMRKLDKVFHGTSKGMKNFWKQTGKDQEEFAKGIAKGGDEGAAKFQDFINLLTAMTSDELNALTKGMNTYEKQLLVNLRQSSEEYAKIYKKMLEGGANLEAQSKVKALGISTLWERTANKLTTAFDGLATSLADTFFNRSEASMLGKLASEGNITAKQLERLNTIVDENKDKIELVSDLFVGLAESIAAVGAAATIAFAVDKFGGIPAALTTSADKFGLLNSRINTTNRLIAKFSKLSVAARGGIYGMIAFGLYEISGSLDDYLKKLDYGTRQNKEQLKYEEKQLQVRKDLAAFGLKSEKANIQARDATGNASWAADNMVKLKNKLDTEKLSAEEEKKIQEALKNQTAYYEQQVNILKTLYGISIAADAPANISTKTINTEAEIKAANKLTDAKIELAAAEKLRDIAIRKSYGISMQLTDEEIVKLDELGQKTRTNKEGTLEDIAAEIKFIEELTAVYNKYIKAADKSSKISGYKVPKVSDAPKSSFEKSDIQKQLDDMNDMISATDAWQQSLSRVSTKFTDIATDISDLSKFYIQQAADRKSIDNKYAKDKAKLDEWVIKEAKKENVDYYELDTKYIEAQKKLEKGKTEEVGKLNEQQKLNEINMWDSLAGAASQYFDENSSAAKALQLIEIATATYTGATAILNAGASGDGYTAAARMAAAAVVVGGVLQAAGIANSFGGGGGSSTSKDYTAMSDDASFTTHEYTTYEEFDGHLDNFIDALDTASEHLERLGADGTATSLTLKEINDAYTTKSELYTKAYEEKQQSTSKKKKSGGLFGGFSSHSTFTTDNLVGNLTGANMLGDMTTASNNLLGFDSGIYSFDGMGSGMGGAIKNAIEADFFDLQKEWYENAEDVLIASADYSKMTTDDAIGYINASIGDGFEFDLDASKRQQEQLANLNAQYSANETLLAHLVPETEEYSKVQQEQSQIIADTYDITNSKLYEATNNFEDLVDIIDEAYDRRIDLEDRLARIGLSDEEARELDLKAELEEETDAYNQMLIQEIYAKEDALKALEDSYNEQKESLEEYLNDTTSQISELESTFDSLIDIIDRLRGTSEGSSYSLNQYYDAIAKAQETHNSDDINDAIAKANVLFDSSAFESSKDMEFAQLVSANQFEELGVQAETEIDYLRQIEANTRAQIDAIVDSLNHLGDELSDSYTSNDNSYVPAWSVTDYDTITQDGVVTGTVAPARDTSYGLIDWLYDNVNPDTMYSNMSGSYIISNAKTYSYGGYSFDDYVSWANAKGVGIPSTITGFSTGGYTGNYGVNEIAGVVHGQEFVVDAPTTKNLGLNDGSGGVFNKIYDELKLLRAENVEMKKELQKINNVNSKTERNTRGSRYVA